MWVGRRQRVKLWSGILGVLIPARGIFGLFKFEYLAVSGNFQIGSGAKSGNI